VAAGSDGGRNVDRPTQHDLGTSALAVTLMGRPGDAVTAGITTTVVMVVAAVSPLPAWQQPILRFADTVIGVIAGVAAAWIGLRVIRPRLPG
jgi:uncharacterized membrane protein YccC